MTELEKKKKEERLYESACRLKRHILAFEAVSERKLTYEEKEKMRKKSVEEFELKEKEIASKYYENMIKMITDEYDIQEPKTTRDLMKKQIASMVRLDIIKMMMENDL